MSSNVIPGRFRQIENNLGFGVEMGFDVLFQDEHVILLRSWVRSAGKTSYGHHVIETKDLAQDP